MEEPAFQSQLEANDLAELGRMMVNFGYAELLLDWLIGPAYGIANKEATRSLISPINIERKIGLLKASLDNCPNDDARELLKSALSRLKEIREDRNTITHGYWAFANGKGAAVFNRKQGNQAAAVKTATELADIAAIATRELYSAFDILNGREPIRATPDILKPEDNGSFTVIRRGRAAFDPPAVDDEVMAKAASGAEAKE